MMNFRFLVLIASVALLWGGCRKTETPEPPASSTFELIFYNKFNLLEAQFAVFLSDADGKVRAFRWLPANDSAHVTVPGATSKEQFDCTVVKITTVLSPGTGIQDTVVSLTTYTNLYNGAGIHLHDPNYLQSTDWHIQFTNVASIDSIIVPESLTFTRPQAANNFEGQYRVLHTGRFWCRLRINGEAGWRYVLFDSVSTATLDTTLDASVLPAIPASTTAIALPLLAPWSYQLDRVVDVAKQEFLAIGAPLRVPGGAIPVLNKLDVYEPPNLPYGGYRLRLSGFDDAAGEGYTCDQYFDTLPAAIPPLGFDIQPTVLADNRLVGVLCSGIFDLLSFTRVRNAPPSLSWEVLVPPSTDNGLVTYRLPDVPAELSARFAGLGSYDFDGAVRVRAENYDQLNTYPEAAARRMLLDDPLWQMKTGYQARERVF